MSVLFLTGAGISANAGIPVYRQAGSSWTDSDLEEKSHANRYGNHLDELWDKHWGPLSVKMLAVEPTYTHKAIAEWQKGREVIIATQNIDMLHEKGGSDNVAHLHGEMKARCMRCPSKDVYPWQHDGAPHCAECGSRKTRPDVVLFGEQLPKKMFKGVDRFSKQPETTHVIAVGTSLNVYPAAGLIMDVLGKVGKKVIIINKEPTPFDKWGGTVFNEDCDTVIDDVLASVDSDTSV